MGLDAATIGPVDAARGGACRAAGDPCAKPGQHSTGARAAQRRRRCGRRHPPHALTLAQALVNTIGTVAGLVSMASFTPQLIKIVRERRAEGVSLRTYLITVTGFVLWIGYGVLLGSWPVAISNTVNVLLSGAILILKWRYRDRQSDPREA